MADYAYANPPYGVAAQTAASRVKPGNDARAAHRNSYSTVKQQACRASASSRRAAPELCVSVSPSDKQRAQGKPGAGWHPRSRVQMR